MLVIPSMPISVDLVQGLEVTWPVASGDKHSCTPTKSPILWVFYVTDLNSGLRFLVDRSKPSVQDGLGLQSVNGTPIAIYGGCSLTLDLRL